MSIFHSHDGWHWERLDDGSVKIHAISSVVDGHRSVHHVVSADVWASIVASVSANGEAGGPFFEAQAFHAGRPSPEMESWKRYTPTERNAVLQAERDALKAENERLQAALDRVDSSLRASDETVQQMAAEVERLRERLGREEMTVSAAVETAFDAGRLAEREVVVGWLMGGGDYDCALAWRIRERCHIKP